MTAVPGDQLRTLYESLVGPDDMKRVVQEKWPEDIHLEFKQKSNPSSGKLDDCDKWHFSRALSGFANSDGGILLFGIETDKQERAHRLKPITGVAEFYSALKKSLLNTTQ